MKICVEKTAIVNGVAQSILHYHTFFPAGSHVLDYGAGKLRNALFLKEQGFQVSLLDTPTQIAKVEHIQDWQGVYTTETTIEENFDGIVCNFVLNVVPSVSEREDILRNIERYLKPNGIVIIEVRGKRGILVAKHKELYSDGYVVGNGNVRTFQKPYTLDELILFVTRPSFEILEKRKYSDSVAIVLRRRSL